MIRIQLIVIGCLLGLTGLRAQVAADFSASVTTGCASLSVKFTDLSTGSPNDWTWGFDNGQISHQQNPTMVFTQPGTYSISLIAKNTTNGNGDALTKTDYIIVFPAPAINFKSDIQISCAPANVNFMDLSTPGQGTITGWSWDFGDGSSPSTDQNPTHVFTTEGYFNIKLIATNSGGCSNTSIASRYIRVIPGVKPDFSFAQTSASCSAPFNINFINQTSGPGTLSYSWDLGNGNTSIATNPSDSYPTNNPYTITLNATSSLGCKGTITKPVSFQGNTPVISSGNIACLNAPISFSNASTPAPISSTWDFGDGNTSTQTNPDNTYTAIGTYTVTLTNNYGTCSSSATKTITVGKYPNLSFTADNTVACSAPFTVNFKDNTVGATSWSWTFGDGGTSTLQNPSHTYTSIGSFNVGESVGLSAGCQSPKGTNNNYIKIVGPSATLDAVSLKGCTGIPLKPTATVDAPDGVKSYLWEAPGATPASSTLTTPSFTFGAQGSYDITLTITTNGNCTFKKTFPAAISIGDPVAPKFTELPPVSCAHRPITFTFAPTGTNPPVEGWEWRFGDGDTALTGPVILHKYADTGFFDVTLFVTHKGCTLSHTEPKFVYINGPVAGFKYVLDCNNRTHVTFSDTSKAPVTDPITSYKWDFGDGTPPSTGKNPIHDYTIQGLYSVQLIVANGTCIDTITTDVNLVPLNPDFNIKPTDTCRYQPFTLISTTPTATIDHYTWQIGAAFYTTDTASLVISVPDTGAHTINLVVTDVSGCDYPAPTKSVNITGPTAKFTPAALGGCRNNPIVFTDNSTPYRTNTITSWSWNFGDSLKQTFTTPPFTHQYADTGTYRVTLTVKDNKGCTDTFALAAATKISNPRVGFFARDTLYCPNISVPFTDTSKGKNLTYSWDFGDGSGPDATINPTHLYTTNDKYYDVKLKVTDATGCSDSVISTKYIHIEKPIAAFTMEDSTGICIPLQTTFLPAGKYYDSLYWDFGDGITSTLDTTTHFYNKFGPVLQNYTYNVKLVLQGAGGCRDSSIQGVHIYQPYDVTKFNFSPISKCDSITAMFDIQPPPSTRFTVFFGDGAADSTNNLAPQHLYNIPSFYNPQISLVDSTGCVVAKNNGTIKVLGATPFFSINKRAFCDTFTVLFHGLAPSNDGLMSATWNFGDGNSVGAAAPPTSAGDPFWTQDNHYTGSPNGRLSVFLQVTTNSGCSEIYTDTVHIWQTPHPQISTSGLLCTGLIQFNGDVTIPNPDSVNYDWTFSSGSASSVRNPLVGFPPGPITAHLKTSVDFGCSDTISQIVNILPLPEIKGPKVITTPVGIPVTLPFTYSPGVTTYAWSPANTLDCTDCANPLAAPTFNTTYTVKVTDTNQCTSLDTIRVKTICGGENYFIPNTFSPNGDGVNDVFYPRGKGLHNIQSMRIFNRWGQLIFERKDFPANSTSDGWNGTTNGRPAPPDAYIYIIEIVCINAQIIALHGDITLIR